jgi:hypothetical protein
MAFRECVCGCDRELPLPLTGINADAETVQQELMEWDGFRHMMVSLANYGDGTTRYDGQLDPFIDAGAMHYRDMLAVIHQEAPAGLFDQKTVKRWIKFSRKERRKIGRGSGIMRTEKVLGARLRRRQAGPASSRPQLHRAGPGRTQAGRRSWWTECLSASAGAVENSASWIAA